MRRAIILLALIGCRHSCPKPSLPATPPAQITVTPDRTPCELPALPEPMQVVGFPTSEGVMVSKSDLAGLASYLVAVRSYVEAAALCLGVRK